VDQAVTFDGAEINGAINLNINNVVGGDCDNSDCNGGLEDVQYIHVRGMTFMNPEDPNETEY
jgi:hypothetical protein